MTNGIKQHREESQGLPGRMQSHCAHSFGHTQGSGASFFCSSSVGRRIPRIFRSFLTGFEIVLADWNLFFSFMWRGNFCVICFSKGKWSDRTEPSMDYSVLANSIGCYCRDLILPVETWQFPDVDRTDSAQDIRTERNQMFFSLERPGSSVGSVELNPMHRGFVVAAATEGSSLTCGPSLHVTLLLLHPIFCHLSSHRIKKSRERPKKIKFVD